MRPSLRLFLGAFFSSFFNTPSWKRTRWLDMFGAKSRRPGTDHAPCRQSTVGWDSCPRASNPRPRLRISHRYGVVFSIRYVPVHTLGLVLGEGGRRGSFTILFWYGLTLVYFSASIDNYRPHRFFHSGQASASSQSAYQLWRGIVEEWVRPLWPRLMSSFTNTHHRSTAPLWMIPDWTLLCGAILYLTVLVHPSWPLQPEPCLAHPMRNGSSPERD
jgi:hypothetical protein